MPCLPNPRACRCARRWPLAHIPGHVHHAPADRQPASGCLPCGLGNRARLRVGDLGPRLLNLSRAAVGQPAGRLTGRSGAVAGNRPRSGPGAIRFPGAVPYHVSSRAVSSRARSGRSGASHREEIDGQAGRLLQAAGRHGGRALPGILADSPRRSGLKASRTAALRAVPYPPRRVSQGGAGVRRHCRGLVRRRRRDPGPRRHRRAAGGAGGRGEVHRPAPR